MKRRFGLLAAAAMVATIGFIAPSSPASADAEDVCAGQGVANLGAGLSYPIGPKATTTFGFSFTVGACVTKASLQAGGTVNGWCGLSTGAGSTNNGHEFVFQSQGTVLVLSGEVIGTVEAIPDPTHSGSCLNGTATRFLITGEVVLHECAGNSETSGGTRRTDKATNTSVMVCV